MDDTNEKLSLGRRFLAWFPRWQEFVGFMPVVFAIALALWVLFGGASMNDSVRALMELPIRVVYAIAACGLTYLLWRRWSYRMDEAQLRDYWDRLMKNSPGAMLVYAVNALFYLAGVTLFLWFLK